MAAASTASGSTGVTSQAPSQPAIQSKAIQGTTDSESDQSSSSDGDDAAKTSNSIFEPTHCLFCSSVSGSIDTNLDHMSKSHGMMIPSPHQLTVDPTTLLGYLHLVISVYHECLTCGTQRRNTQAIKQHMLGKKHCAFDISDVESEYREFWNFGEDGSGVQIDGESITLPSGRVVMSRSGQSTQQRQRSSESGPMSWSRLNASSLEASSPSTSESSNQPSNKQALTKQDLRAINLDKQLGTLRTSDRLALAHLPASEQRAILATQHSQLQKARRQERDMQARLQRKNNQTLMKHFVPDVPGPKLVKRRKVDPSPPSSPPSGLDEFIRTPKSSTRRDLTALHSPSTSPPPAPPKQEFMRPGWEADDGWRMVTDEFTATAQLFTAHLAHAEYRRQKELAKNREKALGGADAIARPVVGQLSKEGQRKKQGELQRQGVKAIMKAEEEEEEDPWVGTQLAGLMMSPRKRERLQPVKVVGRSSTRAAAGFDRARPLDLRGRPLDREQSLPVKKEIKAEQESTDDDDLDATGPSRSLSRPGRSEPPTPTPSRPNRVIKQSANPRTTKQPSHRTSSSTMYSSDPPDSATHKKCDSIDREISRPPPKRTTYEPTAVSVKTEHSLPAAIKTEPDFGFPSFPSIPQPSQSATSAVARRREARLKREKEEKKIKTENQDLHELPTFLF
ncbi:hypothetical protein E4T52_05926 [Aureobasidium sp. EXF-3400]|nr:hypothetical protein E4T51_03805 [Aureobasidium sp. EXF-12344]KAI4779162.1 hypothetical protein E4T52_05926 [Aureobasidium sp. EXF-3400]